MASKEDTKLKATRPVLATTGNEGKAKRKRKAKDPNAPKRGSSAYLFFMKAFREQLASEGTKMSSMTELTKVAAEKWSKLSEEQKKPFSDQAAKDKARYQEEMKLYRPSRDPNKPKRPLSAYFRFMAEFRKQVADKGMSVTDIAKLGGATWTAMTESEKKPYRDSLEVDMKIFNEVNNTPGVGKRGEGDRGPVQQVKKAKVEKKPESSEEEQESDEEAPLVVTSQRSHHSHSSQKSQKGSSQGRTGSQGAVKASQ
ncbi:PREDICTED: DNA-binding protein MNB1B-like [Priapulus caudatus]|uniref:DNA-binding protein MNB1B-like n=1 Tax=Priapulus caudatus TaxID=37621 RepID=A0ABM1F1E0_PRICU|nr:PREDICTED: DNA-binding protein MNB1B-like [Priapulus caudatus]